MGVIGPEDVVQQVQRLAVHYPELQTVPLPQTSVTQTPHIVARHQKDLDIILFTSEAQIVYCRNKVELEVPVVSVPFSPSSLYQALFRARHLLGPDGAFISVDGMSADQTAAALRDLGLPTAPAYAQELHAELSTEEIIDFHIGLWRQGKTRAIFTYSRAAYPLLKALNAPVFLVEHPDPVIHQTLQMALIEAKALRNKDSQIMFGFVDVDRFADICRDMNSEYEIQKFRLRLQEAVLDLVQPMSGVLVTEPVQDFSVVTTRGMVEELSQKFSQAVFVHRIQEEFGVSISEGWGAGPVADRARYHAQTAIRFAKKAGGGCSFIVLDDTRCIGPLGAPSQVSVPLTNLDPEVLAMAAAVGVSARTIERLRFLVRKLGRSEITSDEVAQELRMTERNARRILQKLQNTKLVSVEGQGFAHPRGRPRRVYRIHPSLAP